MRKLTWQDVKRIVNLNKSGVAYINWEQAAVGLNSLMESEPEPEPRHWLDMTWEEREVRIREIVREEIQNRVCTKRFEAGITNSTYPFETRWTGDIVEARDEAEAAAKFSDEGYYRNLVVREVK